MTADLERLDRAIIAMRVAKELPPGASVNLGIGIPTLVSMFVADDSIVFYHSESGVLNCGPLAEEGSEDIDLINAGGQFLQSVPGMAYFSSVDAFAMIRGGHVDVTVLGAHQVSATGDLATGCPRAWRRQHRRRNGLGCRADQVIVPLGAQRPQRQPKSSSSCDFPSPARAGLLVGTDVRRPPTHPAGR